MTEFNYIRDSNTKMCKLLGVLMVWGDRVWVGTQVSSQCIVFWMPFDIIIGRVLYNHLGVIANLLEYHSIIYWTFDCPLPHRSNSSRILLMMKANNMHMCNTLSGQTGTLNNLLNHHHQIHFLPWIDILLVEWGD